MEFFALLVFILVMGGGVWVLIRLLKVDKLEARVGQLEADLQALRAQASTPSVSCITPAVPVVPAASVTIAIPASEVPRVEALRSPPVPQPEVTASPVTPVSAAPEVPAFPQEPMPLVALGAVWWKKLLGENPVVRLGLGVFLLGISFLIRLAAQAGLFPPELRLLMSSLAGAALLGLGWRLRSKRPAFALPLQGGAIGTLLLVVFSAFRLYGLLSSGAALAVAVVLLVLTGFLSVVQNSRSLAFFGLVAGFAAPLLLSSGSGNYIGLFSYYALLDAAIFAIAWFRSWRLLHVSAFLATYVIGTVWGVLDYSSSRFVACEIFLWLYYALFAGTAILFARRAYRGVFGYVDGTLTFGLPLVTFAIQYVLVEKDAMQLAWTAVAMAVHHLVLAFWLWRSVRRGEAPHLRVMAETLAVLGTSFASLALPLALSGQATAVAWCFEGAGLVFLGLRQQRIWSLSMGGLLVLLGSLVQWGTSSPHLAATAVVVVALWLCAWMLDRLNTLWKIPGGIAFVALAWAWVGALHDLGRTLDAASLSSEMYTHWLSGGMGVLALLVLLPAFFLRWGRAAWLLWPSFLLWLGEVLLRGVLYIDAPSAEVLYKSMGWFAHLLVPVLFAGALVLVRLRGMLSMGLQNGLQGILLHGMLWLGVATFFGFGRAVQGHAFGNWPLAFALLFPAVVLWGVGRPVIQERWLQVFSPTLYKGPGVSPWVLGVLLTAFATLFQAAGMPPLPFLPLLNPLDLAALLALFAATTLPTEFWNGLGLSGKRRWLLPVLFGLAWPGAVMNRLFHHYGGIAWDLSALWDARSLQAGWSLLFTAEALGLMWFAARRHWRPVWMAGAVLLACAVVKLFAVDLSGQGTVARIVSFLGVGGLMVAIGYFSPLPPGTAAEEEKA